MEQQRIQAALDKLVYLPSLKEQSAPTTTSSWLSPIASTPTRPQTYPCRPWDRSDLCRRLQSFKASTWFCKPTMIGPLACARHGWANTGADLLSCESCGAKLSFHTLPGFTQQQEQQAAAKLAERLESGHHSSCAWRRNACDESVASYPPLPQPRVVAEFTERLQALRKLSDLPPIAPSTMECMKQTHSSQLHYLLKHGLPNAAASQPLENGQASQQKQKSQAPVSNGSNQDSDLKADLGLTEDVIAGQGSTEFEQRAVAIALCGWETHSMPTPKSAELSRWDEVSRKGKVPSVPAYRAVLHCSMCGAKAGLWTYLSPRKEDEGASISNLVRAGSSIARLSSTAPALVAGLSGSIAGGTSKGKGVTARASTASPAVGRQSASPAVRPFGSARIAPVFGSKGEGPPSRPTSAAPQTPLTSATTVPAPSSAPAKMASVSQPSTSTALVPASTMALVEKGQTGLPLVMAGGGSPSIPAAAAQAPENQCAATSTLSKATEASTPSSLLTPPPAAMIGGSAQGARASKAPFGLPSEPVFGSRASPSSAAGGLGSPSPEGRPASAPESAGLPPPTSIRRRGPFGSGDHLAPAFGLESRKSASRTPSAEPTLSQQSPLVEDAGAKRKRDDFNIASRLSPELPHEKRAKPAAEGAQIEEAVTQAVSTAPVPVAVVHPDTPITQAEGDTQALMPTDTASASLVSAVDQIGSEIAPEPLPAAAEQAGPSLDACLSLPSVLDPLKCHRPFCPWVTSHTSGEAQRCGWRWTLEALVQEAPMQELTESSSSASPPLGGFDAVARARQSLSKVAIRTGPFQRL